jgi:hypothetical protein
MTPAVAATLCTGDIIAAAAPTELRGTPEGHAGLSFDPHTPQRPRAARDASWSRATCCIAACSVQHVGMQHAACLESICASSPKSLGLPPELDGIALVEATNILRRLPESSSVEEMLLIVKRTVRRSMPPCAAASFHCPCPSTHACTLLDYAPQQDKQPKWHKGGRA